MYKNYYKFKEKPFSLTPDPKFMYMSSDHFDALEHLLYGIADGEGFLLLIGGIGTGKTTLSRVLTERLQDSVIYSLILNPFQDFFSLLKNILWDFGIIPEANTENELINQLIDFLINEVGPKGKTALIIIDEAQNLDNKTLEQLRTLSNVETNKEKLLQFLLLGQEELLVKLESKELRQLNQRIPIRYFLSPLKKNELKNYLYQRIAVGEPEKEIRFSIFALKKIYKFSRGVPRLINIIANRCLLAGFVKGTGYIDSFTVYKALKSLFGEKEKEIRKLKGKKYIQKMMQTISKELE